MTLFDIVVLVLLIAFMWLNWTLPRSLGAAGLLIVHIALVVCYFALAGVSTSIGMYEYDGFLSALGLVLQAFALNCLLLPIALVALWRHNLTGDSAMQMESEAETSEMNRSNAAEGHFTRLESQR